MIDFDNQLHFPLEVEEINYDEFRQFSEDKSPNGNYIYLDNSNKNIGYKLLIINNGVTTIFGFHVFDDLHHFIMGKIDLDDDRYFEYFQDVITGGSTYKSFKDFIRKKYGRLFHEYF